MIFIGKRTRPRAVHSVFTQVCVVACQLLWNNIESGLVRECHLEKGKRNGKKALFYYQANTSWTLSELSFHRKTLYSHTSFSFYLIARNSHEIEIKLGSFIENWRKLSNSILEMNG